MRRADLDLDLLGRPLADQQVVLALDVLDDRLVHLVGSDADRAAVHDAGQRDDRDVGRSAADVHDHVAGRLGDRQARADGRRHRLLDDEHLRGSRASAESWTARFSTCVMPDGPRSRSSGRTKSERPCAFLMKWSSIFSVTSKSAMTPSFIGRIATMLPGRAADHLLGVGADGLDPVGLVLTATIEGSRTTIPCRGRRRACWRFRGRWRDRWRKSRKEI
jgi:hypothetical protein